MRLLPSLLAALFLCACTPLKGASDLTPDASLEAQAEAAPDVSADAGPCTHRTPPAPPDAAAVAASRNQDAGAPVDLVFAVSRTEYGTGFAADGGILEAGPQFTTIGFDLDNMCTGMGSCVEPPSATGTHHAGVDGIDNGYGQLLYTTGPNPDSIDASTDQTEVLLRVRNYHGAPDDDQIDVSLYLALGVSARPDGGTGLLWDGQDRWTILPETLADAPDGSAPSVDQPLFHADQAYVSGGVLVARFNTALWPGTVRAFPRLLITAHELVIAGDLSPVANTGGAWALNNVVTGTRIGLTDVLIVSSYEPDRLAGFDGSPLEFFCKDPGSYSIVKQVVACPFLDITMDPTAPPSSSCDSLSVGLLYEMQPALLGGVAEPAPPLPDCAPGVHPDMDTNACK